MDTSYIYILTNNHHTTLYIGVTSNLIRRIYEHKSHQFAGFTKKYNLDKLVYYEKHYAIVDAIKREKQLKKWNRSWKIRLIEKMNPSWQNLCEDDGSMPLGRRPSCSLLH